MKYKCDLHLHSSYSDGELTPAALINIAKEKNLFAVSLTDHDTVQGLNEADEAAKRNDIKFVGGIELSSYTDFEVHILGYNVPYSDKCFLDEIAKLGELRKHRNEKIIQKLLSQGIKLKVGNLFEEGAKGRQHIADLLFEQGFVRSRTEAFDKYIGTNKPCFVKSHRITTKQAISLIKEYGGIPVVAHPMRYAIKINFDSFVAELVEWGIMGIEVYYSTELHENEMRLKKLADNFQLIATGGSDFHSSSYGSKIGGANAYLEENALRALNIDIKV